MSGSVPSCETRSTFAARRFKSPPLRCALRSGSVKARRAVSGKYAEFLDAKTHLGSDDGFDPKWVPDFLFPFQSSLVTWAIRKGRAAIFADCGMGKTPMQLVWAENIVRHTGKRVLIVTPLAVSHQTEREAEKFGIEARVSREGSPHAGITITNYERLHHFSPDDFHGVVCDESSAIKNFNGARRAIVTDFMRKRPYRLLCTATAAPNDYIELGTSSEALGNLGHMDMLNRYFKNDQNTTNPNRLWDGGGWRFKRHAESVFWRWVCSWARALRCPSDLGFSNDGFALPDLVERDTLVASTTPRPGLLFDLPATGLYEQRQECRHTIQERCEAVADKVSGDSVAVVWCHLNTEGDLLADMIPGAQQVTGSDSDENKETAFLAFARGDIRVLITKPKIGAFGLNWQHCAHMTFFPSHSFEQYYQAVRRCWRFGQTRPVVVDLITTEGQRDVMKNLQRKAAAADKMFDALVEHMNDALNVDRSTGFGVKEEVPAWL